MKNLITLTGKQLLALIEQHTLKGSIVCTDEFKGYNILQHNLDFIHWVINHQFEYSNGDIHTNNIENFWSILKRGVYGIYHHVSIKYMQRYINEFVFRYNNRLNSSFDILINQCF